MNRKTIELSRWHVAAFAALGISIFLLLLGVVSWYKLRSAVDISKIDIEDLHTGKYVKGEITQYAGREIETANGTAFRGVSASVAYGFTPNSFYDSYTIPALDGKYVTVLIKENDSVNDILEAYDKGKGTGAYFVGKVEKPRYDINYEFWANSTGYWVNPYSEIGNEAEAREKICDKYIIRQIYPDSVHYMMLAGISLMVTSFIGFNAKGGIRVREE